MAITFTNTAAAVSIKENQTVVQTVQATDDLGGVVTYSITSGADQALFAVDTNTGAVTFVSAPDYDNPSDADTNNVYDVEVTATSPNGSQAFTMSVTVTEDNSALEKNLDLTAQIATDMANAEQAIADLQANKADKTALQALQTSFTNLQTSFSTLIDDADGDDAAKVFSKTKINALLSGLQSSLQTAISDSAIAVKDDLLGTAGTAHDTLGELAALYEANRDIIASLQQVAGGRVAFDTVQNLTSAQQTQAQENINVPSNTVFNALKDKVDTGLAGVGNTASYDPLGKYNAKKAAVLAGG